MVSGVVAGAVVKTVISLLAGPLQTPPRTSGDVVENRRWVPMYQMDCVRMGSRTRLSVVPNVRL